MILQALADYYDLLADDPESGVAPFGFSESRISYAVVVDDQGNLVNISDIRDTSGKKATPRSMITPDCGGRTAGVKPFFLADKAAYFFGYDGTEKVDRARECFEAFKTFHLKWEMEINEPAYSAVCRFLEKWKPEDASANPLFNWEEMVTANFVFRYEPDVTYVHQNKRVKSVWAKLKECDAPSDAGECLITGEEAPLATLHPTIKGVTGAQSSGAAIVSFNLDAFTSFGKKQSLNAPVSETSAFKYTTALNRLLVRDNRQCVGIGDMTVVFWTGGVESKVPAFIAAAFSQSPFLKEDTELSSDLKAIFEYVRRPVGPPPSEVGDVDTPFYVLGLSPNAARISVRFAFVSSIGEMLNNLHNHYQALEIEKQYGEGSKKPDPDFPSPRDLLRQTGREAKDIPPLLAGALMQAMLTGGPYPNMWLQAVIRRIRAGDPINFLRAASIKAFLTRSTSFNQKYNSENLMALDTERTDQAYLLGRLFAAYEKAQSDAQGNINATIKDRYYSSASATPRAVFPRLVQLNQHHMKKLRSEKPGYAVNTEKLIGEIMENVNSFPTHIALEEQGLFAIGYYHQRNAFFKKREKDAPTEEASEQL